jgi:hypothetical protein
MVTRLRLAFVPIACGFALASVVACSSDTTATAGASPALGEPPESSGGSSADARSEPDARAPATKDAGANGDADAATPTPPAPTALSASIVRSSGQPFAIANGVLYRLDVASHLLYAGDIDSPATDHVLSDVGPIAAPSSPPRMVVTSTHVVLAGDITSSFASQIRRVPIAGGTTETVTLPGSGIQNYLAVGGNAVFSSVQSGQTFRIDRLASGSTAFSPWFTSTFVAGPENDVVDTLAFAIGVGTTFYGVHLNDGPYVGNAADQTFDLLGGQAWDALGLGTVAGANIPAYAVARRGDEIDVVRRDPSCNPSGTKVPAVLSTWDLDKVTQPKVTPIADGAADLVAGTVRVFFQSWCDGTVTSIDPITLASSTYARPRNNPVPGFPANDVYDWQLRWPLAVDGGFVYFLHENTLRRTAKL